MSRSNGARSGPIVPAVLAFALLILDVSVRASADAGHPPIHVAIDPCVPVQEKAVRLVVAVELRALLTEAAPPGTGVTRVDAACADGRIRLRADDPVTGKSLLRSIDLRTVDPSARARLLGLAIAELVDASWTELHGGARCCWPAWASNCRDG